MYAIMLSGGKQHKVQEGAIVKLEKLDSGIGDTVTFDQVLMVSDSSAMHIGEPLLKNVTVKAEVVEQGRHKKINILKFRRRKHSMKRQGHRQYFTAVKIIKIDTNGGAAKKAATTAETKSAPKAKAPSKADVKTAPKKAAKASAPAKAKATAKPKVTAKAKAAPKAK